MFCWIKATLRPMTEVSYLQRSPDSIQFYLPNKVISLPNSNCIMFSFQSEWKNSVHLCFSWNPVMSFSDPTEKNLKTQLLLYISLSVNALKNKTSWIQMWRKYLSHQTLQPNILKDTGGKKDFTLPVEIACEMLLLFGIRNIHRPYISFIHLCLIQCVTDEEHCALDRLWIWSLEK